MTLLGVRGIYIYMYLHCRGTHGYMAPEVVKKGVQYTYTADWFSLGCVLYKLLKGYSKLKIIINNNNKFIVFFLVKA